MYIRPISFITTLLITVLSFQNILSSRADSVGIRTVKFASSSFIPIIGAAVVEAIKTLSANIGYLKGTLGLSVILSFIVIYAPTLVHVLIVKLFLSICSLVSGACECQDEGALIDGVVDVVDIMLSIIICSMILSLLLVIFFVFITFGV